MASIWVFIQYCQASGRRLSPPYISVPALFERGATGINVNSANWTPAGILEGIAKISMHLSREGFGCPSRSLELIASPNQVGPLSRLPYQVLFLKMLGRQRFGIIIALDLIAAMFAQKCELLLGFDAFGNA